MGGASALRSEGPVDGYSAGQWMSRGELAGQSDRLAFYCFYLLRGGDFYTRRRARPQRWKRKVNIYHRGTEISYFKFTIKHGFRRVC